MTNLFNPTSSGVVLSVVSATTATQTTTNSTSDVDTTLAVTAVNGTTDRVRVRCSSSCQTKRSAGSPSDRQATMSIYRGNAATGTLIKKASYGRTLITGNSSGAQQNFSCDFEVIDTPSAANQLYTMACNVYDGNVELITNKDMNGAQTGEMTATTLSA
tara:strand:- start:587 stop:1063 length:477 start_codon:yes stop_codon:yes gene_type:complete